jgi:hypothetical protein
MSAQTQMARQAANRAATSIRGNDMDWSLQPEESFDLDAAAANHRRPSL